MNHKSNSQFQMPSMKSYDPDHYPNVVNAVVACLLQGGVVPLPTETVYGLAGNAYDSEACQAIFRLKGRPLTAPLIVHYADIHQLKKDVIWNASYDVLANAFWPGPLTFVLKRREESLLSHMVSGGQETVAVRIPQAPWMAEVIRRTGFPLAAPSANPSGSISPTCVTHVKRFWGDQLPLYVDGGMCRWGIESTLVAFRSQEALSNSLKILRPGAITENQLQAVWKGEIIDFGKGESEEGRLSHQPGSWGRHYAPQKPLRLEASSVETYEGLLAFGSAVLPGAAMTLNLSLSANLEEAAHVLFRFLHHLDISPQCHAIAVMPIPYTGLGLVLNNRLKRASLAL